MSELSNKKGLYTVWRLLKYIIVAAIVTGIVLAVYKIKLVYPFGEFTIAYSDMAYNYIPALSNLWDILNGENASTQVLWLEGLGINYVQASFSVFNLLFLFIERDFILNFMSYMLIMKMVAIAWAMLFFLNKKFPKISDFWKLLFATLYPLSSYTLLYYTNIMWLDLVMLLPFLVMALDSLAKNGRILPYVIALTVMFYADFNVTAMVLLQVLILSGVYIAVVMDKSLRRRRILELAIGTAGAILCGMGAILPSLIKMLSSSRVESAFSGDSVVADILTTMDYSLLIKYLMLIGLSLPMFLFIVLFKNRKRDPKNIAFASAVMVMCIIPMVFENVNIMLHFGTYQMLPMRFGFIIPFFLITAGSYCLDKGFKLDFIPSKGRLGTALLIAGAVISAGFAISNMISAGVSFSESGCLNQNMSVLDNTVRAAAAFGLFILSFLFIFSVKNKRVIYAFVGVVVFADMFVNTYSWMAADPLRTKGTSSSYVEGEIGLRNQLGLERELLTRVRNYDASTGHTNYPIIIERAALTNWAHVIHGDLIDMSDKLGYTVAAPMIMDCGGTLLSDALLNIKEFFGTWPLDEELYEPVMTGGNDINSREFTYYQSRYNFPLGITAYDSIIDDLFVGENKFDYQNNIYSALTGDESALFETIHPENTGESYLEEIGEEESEPGETMRFYPDADTEILRYNIKVEGRKILYVYVDSPERYIMNFVIGKDGEYITDDENVLQYQYPNASNANFVCLGLIEDEEIEFIVEKKVVGVQEGANVFPGTYEELEADLNMALMDYDKFIALCESYEGYDAGASVNKNTLTMTVENSESDDREMLLLPFCYDSGWTCKINGVEVEYYRAVGSLMAVRLQEGVNNIELSYIAPGFIPAWIIVIISVIGTIALLIYCKVKKHRPKLMENPILLKVVSVIYGVVYGAAILVVLVIPIGCGLVKVGISDLLVKITTLISTGTLAE